MPDVLWNLAAGLPIYDKNGKQIGAIGVSGGSVAEDTSVAQAGLNAVK